MKPIDKKGRPIYAHIFAVLKKYGRKLDELHWIESVYKPNLFRKSFGDVLIFADMRGTEVIPIWQEPYPLIYVDDKCPEDWKMRRALRKAIEELEGVGIPHRFSFYDECESEDVFSGYDVDFPDGLCRNCGKEFDADGLFCSEDCEKNHLSIQKQKEEERLAEEKAQEKAREVQQPKELTSKKPKVAKKKKTRDKANIETALLPYRYNQSNKFDPPSELFKKRLASRDRVKHARY